MDRHVTSTVINGDCLDALKTLPGESVDLVFTSPEYYGAPMWENKVPYKEYLTFHGKVMDELVRVVKEGGFIVYNVAHLSIYEQPARQVIDSFPLQFNFGHMLWERGLLFREDIIWVKPDGYNIRLVPTLGHPYSLCYAPNWTTEHVIVYRKGKKHQVRGQEQEDNVIPRHFINKFRSDVWKISGVKDPDHPAVFPLELAMNVIVFYSLKGSVVLDPFAGIGTTGIACIKSDRRYILIEKNEGYYKEALNRLKKESGVMSLDEFFKKSEPAKPRSLLDFR
jgi:DNA modification methylase